MKKHLLFAILTITISIQVSFSYSQIVVTPSATPAQMVSNLVGPGITYSNVVYTGVASASGTFSSGNLTNLGMNSGVVLTTGSAALVPINNSGSEGASNGGPAIPALNTIATANTFDGVTLEFDFIPYSNSLNVKYIFGSDEYLEYVNKGFNDAFAFFISGPGIAGQVNLATVAGLPVTIDNVNNVTNSAYYINNPYNGSLASNKIEYDGFTTALLATKTVIPCSTYHIKLMIADGGDAALDSGVFIEENGFFSSGAIASVSVQPAYGLTNAVEGCGGSQFVFTMPNVMPTNSTFNYTVGGTATQGTDYIAIPNSVTILAGQTVATLPINVLSDGIAEGMETITLTVQISPCSTQTFTMNLVDPTPLSVTATNASFCQGAGPANISATPIGGDGIITYAWDNGGGTGTPVSVNPATTTTYTVTATDQCGKTNTANSIVTVTPLPTATFTATSPICVGNASTITYTGSAATAATYTWNFGGATATPGGTTQGPHNATWATNGTYNLSLTVNSNGCTSLPYSQSVLVNPTPTAPTISSNSPVCAGGTINFTANAITGATYVWSGPGGYTASIQNPTRTSATVAMSGTYNAYVVVNGCTSATANTNVVVNPIPSTPTISSNTPICQGATVNLTSNAIAGATYVWSGPSAFASSVQNPSLSPAAVAMSGSYNAYVVVLGCTSATATTPVVVNPLPATPVISSNSPICSGGSINLTASSVAGATYSWSGPNAFASSAQNPTLSPATVAMGGTYSAYTVASACTSATANTTVVVNATPAMPTIGSNGPICSGATLNLTATAVTGATYGWSGPNAFTSAVQNPSIPAATVAASGNYTLYTVVSGCTSAVATVNALVKPLPAAPTIASNTPVCVNGALNFTANTTAGATYAWSGPNTFSSALQNPTIASATAAMGGTYSAYIVVNGCTSATANTNVVVNPIPAAPSISSNTPVCAGSALNLTANTIAGATYAWSGPNTFSSSVQNPTITSATVAASGSYSAYVVVLGCTSSVANHTATVNPIPATPVISSNTPVCQGGTVNLASNAIAGATYVWSGPSAFASSVQNPSLSPAAVAMSGSYNAYVVVLGCTSATATTPVVVNPLPATPVISSNSPICSGGSINLTASSVAGATYSWSGPNAFASSAQNPTLSPATVAMGGTYSAYTVASACTSATANTTVVVNATPAMPTIGSNGPICSGATLNLTATAVTGATYGWSGPNAFTSAVQNPSIPAATVAASGNYTLYTVVSGCTSAVATVNALVKPLPAAPTIASNTPVCVNGALNFTANTTAGATYAWSGPNTFSSALQNPTIASATAAMGGTYSAYIVVNGCTSATANTNVVVNPIPAAPSISSNTPVCAGSALNLTANTIAGATYAWSGPNTFSSSVQNPTITSATVAASGSYSAYVVVLGCTSSVANHTATVNPIPAAPVISSNTPVCEGNSINLTSNTIAGATYVWSGPNAYTASAEDPSITSASISNAGMYNAYVVVLGCTSAVANTPVAVNLTPVTPVISSNSPICDGGSIQLSANTVANATYVWSGPNAYSSSVEDPTLSPATVGMSGNYTAYILVAGCSSATATTAVVVNATPLLPVISSNGPVCLGSNIQLTSNTVAGATYVWSGPNGYTSSNEDPTMVATDLNMSGIYSLYIVTTACTSANASTNVVVNPMPTADFAVTPQICLGANAFALYNGTAPATATYNWVAANGTTSGTGQGPINITWTTPGTQNLILNVTQNGCTSLPVTHSVNVIAPVTPNAGPDQTACSGDMLTVGAQNQTGATFTWITPNGINDPASAYSTGSWINSTNSSNTVTITLQSDNQGCLATDNAVITIVPIPVASFNAPATQCFSNNLFSFSAGGTHMANATYNWAFSNASTASSTAQNPSGISFTTPGSNNITLIITQSGCQSAPFTTQVTVASGPQAAFNELPVQGCAPMLVNFTDMSVSVAGGITYTWSFGNGAGSSQVSPSNTYTQPGIYSVTLNIQDNSGCSSSVTKNNIIKVYGNPIAGFSANPEIIYIDQPVVNVNNGSSSDVVTWDYVISNGAHLSVSDFTMNFSDTGYYSITQTVTNQYGCSDVFISEVHVLPVTEIFVPNAFTPDGNDNINAVFKPSGNNFDGYRMFIFNRWGELLFSTADKNEGWDGTVRNSSTQAKQDLYVYKIQYVDHRGNEKELLGNVMVLR